ncbi:MAG: extracellular solute-binding protein [Blautia sp.]|nr:extracellular solute-binding protein [Blautia sp.]MCM1202204.1 extracellular solute-binding protein [Bacteroides fragilis]
MIFKRRFLTVFLVACAVGGLYVVSSRGLTVQPEEEAEEIEEPLFGHRETLYLWYTDEALTDYLNSAAVAYNDFQEEARVIPVHTSGAEYLETINQASLHSEEVPDLYIVGNDSLEKAYLAGLASEIRVPEGISPMQDFFADTALHAAAYHDKQIGYPFYFETSSFLYNKTYLEEWARAQIEAENDLAAAEAAAAELAQNGPEEEADGAENTAPGAGNPENAEGTADEDGIDGALVAERVEQALPETIDDILAFADVYDAPEQVEAIFKWDVSDIFYNYFFVGNYIDVGGPAGDRADSVNIYNEDAIRCMRVYQDLNQFFSIDTEEISYADILQDFIDGKIVYTVVTTDALARIEEAKENGEFQYEYGTSLIPDVNEELVSRSLSVTQCIVVNGYSVHKDMANDFAVYLSCYNADNLYDRTGKIPAKTDVIFENGNVQAFIAEYEKSAPNPKMIGTSNYWVEMEIAFARIWAGNDANAELKSLSEKIMTQVKGEEYEEEYIDVPEEEPEFAEEGAEGGAGEADED